MKTAPYFVKLAVIIPTPPGRRAPRVSPPFNWRIRVYYDDTDAGGVVYHANYLKYMEQARTEWLRAVGFEQTDLLREFGVRFVIRAVEVTYRQPAYFNDLLEVGAELALAGHSLMHFSQTVTRLSPADRGGLLAAGRVQVVCVNRDGRPARTPEPLHTALKTLM